MYSRDEKVDILLIYGECRKNATAARSLYAQRYPQRQHPCRQYFSFLERKFRQEVENPENNNFIIDEATEINVLTYVELNPTVSTREIGHELGISRESARKILEKRGFCSYKYQLHQHLYEDDANRRLNYCDWLLHNYNEDHNFVKFILFSDESRFTNNGMFNRQNTRYWAQENRHLMRQGNFQERFAVNVWAGIVGTRIIGPILFQGRLNGQRYLEFLQNDIEEFLEELPLEILRRLYFQQDGAPPHNAAQVVNYLSDNFGEKVIATNGPIRWPPRSPDLTPLDFFLWGYVKDYVYHSTPPATLEILENRILQAFETITPVMLEEVAQNTIYRSNRCMECGGLYFEHLL